MPTWTAPDGTVYYGTDLLGRGVCAAHNRGGPFIYEDMGPGTEEYLYASWGFYGSSDGPDMSGESDGPG